MLCFWMNLLLTEKQQRLTVGREKGSARKAIWKTLRFQDEFYYVTQPSTGRGIVGTTKTFNQDKYAEFLRTLIVKLKSDPEIEDKRIVLVANNYRFHRTNQIKKIFEKERLVWLFIPPYSPETNACEKL